MSVGLLVPCSMFLVLLVVLLVVFLFAVGVILFVSLNTFAHIFRFLLCV